MIGSKRKRKMYMFSWDSSEIGAVQHARRTPSKALPASELPCVWSTFAQQVATTLSNCKHISVLIMRQYSWNCPVDIEFGQN